MISVGQDRQAAISLHSVPRQKLWILLYIPLLFIALWLLWPMGDIFPRAYSRVVYDVNDQLLRVTLAPDGQVRFPLSSDTLPAKYVATVLACEDQRFFLHPGVDPFALTRSLIVNVTHKRRIRGGSTLTMQVARMSQPKPRTYLSKLVECAVALKLSLHFSKKAVLEQYAAHVPMGGNTVGIETASWRYLGKPPAAMTWADAALFTVLPNAPSSYNIEKRRPALKTRRDTALGLLVRKGIIDSMTYKLSCAEPLPEPGSRLPFRAPHFANRVLAESRASVIHTTLNVSIQRRVEEFASISMSQFAEQGVHNIAALVVHTGTGAVAAYAGSQSFSDTLHNGQVDGVIAQRSTGSLLKPFLVAKALDRGPYVMESKLQDVPTFYGSFSPQNASMEHSGLVTMHDMLVQSLNVPAVRLLYWYGVQDLYVDLRRAGMSGLFRSPDGYGLSLILGGAESSLWDLTRLFATLGSSGVMRPLWLRVESQHHERDTVRFCSPGAAWLVLTTLSQLNRPGSEFYWRFFTGQVPVAWKTGTSYGQKDAWAIGVNAQWTIGVWVGNFTGQGNPVLGGAQSAGPLLFQLFNSLSDDSREMWFDKPEYDLRPIKVCPLSGLPPSSTCTNTITVLQPSGAYESAPCSFHQRILTSRKNGYSVCSRCWGGVDTAWTVRAIVPPSVRSILQRRNFPVDTLPHHNPSCPVAHPQTAIEIIYPVNNISIIVPRNLQGEFEKIVFKAECRQPSGLLYWYLDGRLLGETVERHNLALDLREGKHRLVLESADGSTATVRFSAFSK